MGGLLGVMTSGTDNIWLSVLSCVASAAIVIFITMPIHEWAHGFAAYKLGDPTAKYSGRLKFNPTAHLDPMGALGILLFGIGWAKPVPVNPRYFKNPKRDMAITAFAGPLSNLVLAFIATFLQNFVFFISLLVMPTNVVAEYVFLFLYLMFQAIAFINISLAIFNLVPIPPLDGSKILAAFLSDRAYYTFMSLERYFSFILFALILFSSGFSMVLSNSVSGVFVAFDNICWFPFEKILEAIYL